jgi:NADH-quinone oxidoreductase subunit H
MFILESLFKIVIIVVPLLIAVAYVTLAERKIMASMQLRKGPNVVGFAGLLQPLADGLKLFSKETILPTHANVLIFIFAPILSLVLALLSWAVIPYSEGGVLADVNLGILYLFAISSISVYAILMSGWGSNSKYAFLGAMRAAAQMISYEVCIGLIILAVVVCVGSLNLTDIVNAQENCWFILPLFPAGVMFFVSALAETNRAPFDHAEGESELVSGFNTEYSGMTFALFFLAEYSHIIIMSVITVLLFFGGWLPVLVGIEVIDDVLLYIPGSIYLGLKTSMFVFFFVWVRASFPRCRYDALMQLLWKSYLPLSLGFLIYVASVIIIFS